MANYGTRGGAAIFCKGHALPGTEDVRSRRCPGPPDGPSCPMRVIVKDRLQFCLLCDPDETRRLLYKRAQASFFRSLEAAGVPATQQEVRVDYRCTTAAPGASHCYLDGVLDAPGAGLRAQGL